MRPTEEAKFMFTNAANFAQHALDNPDSADTVRDLAAAVRDLAGGLQSLADGLRATYILLEQIKQKQDRPGGVPGRF